MQTASTSKNWTHKPPCHFSDHRAIEFPLEITNLLRLTSSIHLPDVEYARKQNWPSQPKISHLSLVFHKKIHPVFYRVAAVRFSVLVRCSVL